MIKKIFPPLLQQESLKKTILLAFLGANHVGPNFSASGRSFW
jgi:hypothetical protein